MKTRITLGFIVMMFVLSITVMAEGELQKHFNDAATKVKATENASAKRVILNDSFDSMLKALNKVQSLGMVSKEESEGIDVYKSSLKEKQDELNGKNGFERVSDSQLNDFSTYVVQDMEQASTITISLVTALLIILILVLIL